MDTLTQDRRVRYVSAAAARCYCACSVLPGVQKGPEGQEYQNIKSYIQIVPLQLHQWQREEDVDTQKTRKRDMQQIIGVFHQWRPGPG